MTDTEAHPLIGRDVMVGARAARITGVERANGVYALRYENGGDEDGHCYRDEFYVLPTREQIAEAIHTLHADHPWRSDVCTGSSQRIRLGEADAVLALLNGSKS